jgi:hypothetical protein
MTVNRLRVRFEREAIAVTHMIVRPKARGSALVCLAIVLMTTAVNAQQKILWQGAVQPAGINVYASTSITDRVTTTLKQGDVVDVVLQITVMGSAWCRIAYSGQPEALGDVLCINLQQGHFTAKQAVHSEAVVKQSQVQAPVKSTTQNFSVASAGNVPGLTNKDILDLNKAGLPPEVLVAKIKSSQCNFDTSPASLQTLKAAGLGDSVILAMVEAPVGLPQPRTISAEISPTDNPKPASPATTASTAPKEINQTSDAQFCVIVKRMGPADEVTSHLYSFGIRGKQFQYVEGQSPKGVSFHGRLTDHDVRAIENKGGKVVVIEPKYTTADLDHARQECHGQ